MARKPLGRRDICITGKHHSPVLQQLLLGKSVQLPRSAASDDYFRSPQENRLNQFGNILGTVLIVGIGVDDHIYPALRQASNPSNALARPRWLANAQCDLRHLTGQLQRYHQYRHNHQPLNLFYIRQVPCTALLPMCAFRYNREFG